MAIIIRLDQVMSNRKVRLLELAEKIGITYANLSNLKNNKVTAIRFSTLENLCKELHCQPGDILEYLDDEIMELIDSIAKNDIEKEGALTRLYAYAETKGEKNLSIELAKECFKLKEEIDIEKIQNAVADYYDISNNDLIYQTRISKIVKAKQLAMYICRTKTTKTFKEICEKFNIEDLSLFIYACDKIGEELKNNKELQLDYNNILTNL